MPKRNNNYYFTFRILGALANFDQYERMQKHGHPTTAEEYAAHHAQNGCDASKGCVHHRG